LLNFEIWVTFGAILKLVFDQFLLTLRRVQWRAPSLIPSKKCHTVAGEHGTAGMGQGENPEP